MVAAGRVKEVRDHRGKHSGKSRINWTESRLQFRRIGFCGRGRWPRGCAHRAQPQSAASTQMQSAL